MSFVKESGWTSASVVANTASTTITPAFSGGGFELFIAMVTVDTSNSATSAMVSHASFAPGTSFVGLNANGYLNVIVWGIYSGSAGSPSFGVVYSGGNSGATGGKIEYAVFTGAASNIVSSPGPSGSSSGSSATASVTLTGVAAGSLTVGFANNTSANNFTAGSGYTLIGNTSAWSGNVTGYEATTGLSEPGGSPNVSMTLTSAAWNMLAGNFPAQPAAGGVNALVYSQRKVLYFI